jgi:pumilio RNA-binding family
MHAAADNPQYFPPYDRRQSQPVLGTAASIWAPQPQPLDATWPRTLDTFSRVAEREVECQPPPQPLVRREDVFGPEPSRSREVGAIGDGRKKISPGFEDNVSFAWYLIFSSIN